MQPERSSENHEPLRKLMQEWTVTTPLPPRFTEGVWRRIEQADSVTKSSLWLGLRDWLTVALSRPVVAAAYVTALLVVGTATGYWQARNETARAHGDLGTRYVQSVDPYQRPRL